MSARVNIETGSWLSTLRVFLLTALLGHLVWECLQLPLYTLWTQATVSKIAFAVVHCTAGDMIITSLTLLGGVAFLGNQNWPRERFRAVAISVLVSGVAYTIYSEWLNVVVRHTWAYAPTMPVLPPFGTGLAPLLQWIAVPAAAIWMAKRQTASTRRATAQRSRIGGRWPYRSH